MSDTPRISEGSINFQLFDKIGIDRHFLLFYYLCFV